MGGGVAHLSVVTAITISGCSLLFIALLRSRLAQKEEVDTPSPSPSPSEAVKRKTKKQQQVVRFADEVEDPRGNGAEYRARLRPRRRGGGGERGSKGGRPAPEEPQERRKKAALCGGGEAAMAAKGPAIPANRRALYRGLCQYRSQMATHMLYHT